MFFLFFLIKTDLLLESATMDNIWKSVVVKKGSARWEHDWYMFLFVYSNVHWEYTVM